jgi:HME family heavy-metal exporter
LNALIRFSLSNRILVLTLAAVLCGIGVRSIVTLPIDIFPSLTRPRVVVMTEAPGLAPEEVESLVTFPLETAFNGASGVEAVRSTSTAGLSMIHIEFAWSMEVYRARQIVTERIAGVRDRLPAEAHPELSPIGSIMGQIMMVGVWSEAASTTPMETRTLADWVIRPRLLSLPGVSQVIVMGGQRRQVQVLVDPDAMARHGVSLDELTAALEGGRTNAPAGFLERSGRELLVRGLTRAETAADVEATLVRPGPERGVLVRDVARVIDGAQLKRGDSSVNGRPAVVLAIAKQPDADTRALTDAIDRALEDLKESLPADLRLDASVFRQRNFIDLGIHNVAEALRDGAILVVIVLALFLMNFRTTFITLTAIPLSIIMTAVVFRLFGLSINVMTLGGIAVAMGELVDDAIVDIENVFRRLRENAFLANPRPKLEVVYEASREVRSSIVFGTMLVILVFVPLFAMSGIEGRLFAPLGVAYIVSILASLVVSLTVTPVLGSLLLSGDRSGHAERESPLLRLLKWLVQPVVRYSMHPGGMLLNLTALAFAGLIAVGVGLGLGTDFLPPFDEGAAQLNLYLPPGSSLESSNRVAGLADQGLRTLMKSPENPGGIVRGFIRRSGRAELDEHAEGVHATEYVIALEPESGVPRAEAIRRIREVAEGIPGVETEVEQPLSHLISHMLSGVTAQIAVKLYGDDLDTLRSKAEEIRAAIALVPGLAPPVVEQQQLVPQLLIELDREKLARAGLTPGAVREHLATALGGRVVATLLEGQRTFDLVVRLDDPWRTDPVGFERLTLWSPTGGLVALGLVARIRESAAPGSISRENVRRRISVRCNTAGRDLGSAVAEIRRVVSEKVKLPTGYFLVYGGQFEAQAEATRTLTLLAGVSLAGIFVTLYTLFPSLRVVLQIMLALPIAWIGGVAALALTGQTVSVAALVGFISVSGIAARNGILLVAHFIHLMREEGESFTPAMVMRGSLERLAPVLMTALTAGIGLVPLVVGGLQPGKEILYPVATVILGGLVTSTVCEYVIHPGLFFRLSGSAATRLARPEPGRDGPANEPAS